MTLFQDPGHVAVNEVLGNTRKLADMYQDCAQRVAEPQVRQLFLAIAAEHDALAVDLTRILSAEGELPKAPDPDAEALHQLLNATREALSPDPARALIEDRLRAERRLGQTIGDACEESALSAPARRRLVRARDQHADVVRRLAHALEQIEGTGRNEDS